MSPIIGNQNNLSAVPALTATEYQEWNNTSTDYPREKCIHQLFEEQVERTPHNLAVVFHDQQLTYQELNDRSNQLAHYLQSLGIKPNSLVGISIERSVEMVVGLLGILKAGATYVPLDPAYPPERVSYILKDSGAELLVTSSSLLTVLPIDITTTICLDTAWEIISRQDSSNPHSGVQPDNLSYVIYTSGSTGQPKGVKIIHRSLVNLITSMSREPGLTNVDRFLAITTICFDIHTLEIYLPLIVGASIIVVSRDVAMDGSRLAMQIVENNITTMQATPATWRILLTSDWPGNRNMKAICGGEALSRELALRLLAKVGRLWNQYGPTETTVYSTIFEVKPDRSYLNEDEAEPIGRPIFNTQIYILDEHLQPLPIGAVGEMYIGGDGLADGYINRPELDAASFRSNPFQPNSRIYKTGDLASYLPDGNIK
jgi:amino acid adenylation domain-containing protein